MQNPSQILTTSPRFMRVIDLKLKRDHILLLLLNRTNLTAPENMVSRWRSWPLIEAISFAKAFVHDRWLYDSDVVVSCC